jgi:hypothetical protein
METYSKIVTYTEIITKAEVGTFTKTTVGYREPKQTSSFIGKNRETYIAPADGPPKCVSYTPPYPLEIDGELYRGWSNCSRNGETCGVYQEQIATVWKPSYNYYNYTIKNRNSVTTYSYAASNGIYTCRSYE